MLTADTTTETRTVLPVYFSDSNKGVGVMVAVRKGSGAFSTACKSIKMVALSNGQYSIRCIGGGFSNVLHVSGTAPMVIMSEGGGLTVNGTVAEVFHRGERVSNPARAAARQ